MPDENLFISKVTSENKGQLIDILSCIIAEGWHVLARLSNFAMDQNFIESLYRDYGMEEYETLQMLASDDSWQRMIAPMVQKLSFLQFLAEIEEYDNHETERMHFIFSRIINNLIIETYGCDDVQRKEILKDILARVCSSYGTHQLSLMRHRIVDRIETDVQMVAENVQSIRLNLISTKQGRKSAFKTILENCVSAGEVIFLRNEIHAIPETVKVEMFLMDSRRYPIKPNFRFGRYLTLESYFYVVYLAFLAYYEIGLREEAKSYKLWKSFAAIFPISICHLL
ncbi:hypothetical protein CHS0354_017161 [Potamilus streckersoni]|uniref:Uncharacterized protein n=1 Tax=Potamilus streckersoni TaxID=2493646 RepID=A0AAE0T3A5_9BIVA|nr:hypothetical protein CHS0354_017161 [Potamilus streckersoni]